MTQVYWASGPSEILLHGAALLANDSDTDRRLSIICIDNAVELLMHTFISLPKRVTSIDLTRKEREDFCINFPSLLSGVEANAEERLDGLDLGQIEWFHRLRNQLYHNGNGLTVERSSAELYLQLALQLFERLSGFRPDIGKGITSKLTNDFVFHYLRAKRESFRTMYERGTGDNTDSGNLKNIRVSSATFTTIGKVEMLWFRYAQKGEEVSSEKVTEMCFLADTLKRGDQ